MKELQQLAQAQRQKNRTLISMYADYLRAFGWVSYEDFLNQPLAITLMVGEELGEKN